MNPFRRKPLTLRRKAAALAVALAADGLQMVFARVPGADQVIDVVAMGVESWLLGFHVLLLPTFVLEFIPVAGLLPTWSGCVVLVLTLRSREPQVVEVEVVKEKPAPAAPPPKLPPAPPVN